MVAFIKTGKLPRNDLTGQRFERLLVREWLGRNNRRQNYWECICDCEKIKKVAGYDLLKARTQSCGCLCKENITKHGMHQTQVYNAWRQMKSRCLNPNNKHWKDYGGRGIIVYQEWINTFESFYADIGEPPSKEHSIDRIDNEQGYYPGNVEWATIEEQANNRRTNRFITFDGETKTIAQFAKIYNLSRENLESRLEDGWSVERALITPVKVYKPRIKIK